MPIHQTAYFVVRDDARVVCEKIIHEFVEYVRDNEPDTLLYTSLQEKENPNHFLHYFIFRDENARDRHARSEAVNRFTSILYPNLIAPVEFTEYLMFADTR
ncbi:MAG TPA: antibiotic biosynthesis monooxygenase [Anaerolineales bacterium]|nr:antibiotic biosynthesis monooxygenase [Anaerolineales bacterium]